MKQIRKPALLASVAVVSFLAAGVYLFAGCQNLRQAGKRPWWSGPRVPLPEPPARLANAAALSEQCAMCHIELAEAFEKDAHAADDFRCVVCHGESKAHLAQEVEGAMPDRVWRRWIDDKWMWRQEKATLEIARLCASCHGRKTAGDEGIPPISWNGYLETKHGKAIARGNAQSPSCTDCHAAHGVSSEPWADQETIELCLSCHGEIEADFKSGTHGSMAEAAPEKKANCAKCHKPH